VAFKHSLLLVRIIDHLFSHCNRLFDCSSTALVSDQLLSHCNRQINCISIALPSDQLSHYNRLFNCISMALVSDQLLSNCNRLFDCFSTALVSDQLLSHCNRLFDCFHTSLVSYLPQKYWPIGSNKLTPRYTDITCILLLTKQERNCRLKDCSTRCVLPIRLQHSVCTSDVKSRDTVSSRDSLETVFSLSWSWGLQPWSRSRLQCLGLVSRRDIYQDSCDLIVRSKNFAPSYVILSAN